MAREIREPVREAVRDTDADPRASRESGGIIDTPKGDTVRDGTAGKAPPAWRGLRSC